MLNNSSYSDSKLNLDLNSNQQGNHTSNNSFSNNISNSNSSTEYQNREISNSNLNGGASNDNTGILSKISNFFKNLNPWKIEEEECIDAHGFKCKRPKTKIPLRKKDQSYEEEIEKAGGESMTYATQHSGFGNMFI